MRLYKFYGIIVLPIDYLCIGAVWIYKIFISPLKPKTCRFSPTCSTYMIDAIREFHFFKGVLLGLGRLIRCNPKNKGGRDPIPPNLRGNFKNLF